MSHQATCLQRLDDEGGFAAVRVFTDLPDAADAIAGLHGLMKHLYWDVQRLPDVVFFGCAGVQHGLATAERVDDPDAADDLRNAVRGLSYDLASFTWPGWGEAAMPPGPTDLHAGRHAARLNLSLARELARDDRTLARAHWVTGAHHLAARETARARTAFDRAVRRLTDPSHASERLLHEGYAALVDVLDAQPDDAYRTVTARLRDGVPGGPGFADQLDTARRVFGRADG